MNGHPGGNYGNLGPAVNGVKPKRATVGAPMTFQPQPPEKKSSLPQLGGQKGAGEPQEGAGETPRSAAIRRRTYTKASEAVPAQNAASKLPNPVSRPQYQTLTGNGAAQPQGSSALTSRVDTQKPAQPAEVKQPNSSRRATSPRVAERLHQAVPQANGTSSSAVPQQRSSQKPRVPKQPMTPAETIRRFGDLLTSFEQSEVLEYQHVYFVGREGANKIKGIPHTPNNNGYDDERGDYKLVVGDHLEYRYEIHGVMGRGSFGQVVKVADHKKDAVLALKIIRNKKRFHHQALVEVKILEHLMGRDKEHKSNIVRVHGYFYFRNHLCITFEPLSMNLYEFIKNNNFKGVSLSLIRRFALQLLQALKFLKGERIIHCDLKPENILLKAPNKSTIRLIDFGSSCFEDERIYTYIQSRFYRSPEVILGLPYDTSIDMWSFGCILSELYTGYPLFPGENETEQIQCIMEILGAPPKRLITASTRKKTFFDPNGKPLIVPNSRGKIRQPGAKDLQSVTKCNDALFLSFLKRCLRWDPKLRMTPDKAMEHPWITGDISALQPGGTPGRGGDSDDEEDASRRRRTTLPTGALPAASSSALPTVSSKYASGKNMFPPIDMSKATGAQANGANGPSTSKGLHTPNTGLYGGLDGKDSASGSETKRRTMAKESQPATLAPLDKAPVPHHNSLLSPLKGEEAGSHPQSVAVTPDQGDTPSDNPH